MFDAVALPSYALGGSTVWAFHERSDNPVVGDNHRHVGLGGMGAGLAGCVTRTK